MALNNALRCNKGIKRLGEEKQRGGNEKIGHYQQGFGILTHNSCCSLPSKCSTGELSHLYVDCWSVYIHQDLLLRKRLQAVVTGLYKYKNRCMGVFVLMHFKGLNNMSKVSLKQIFSYFLSVEVVWFTLCSELKAGVNSISVHICTQHNIDEDILF